MAIAIIDDIRARFNEAKGALRLITFLSPTCGPCRYGQGVVRALFAASPDERLEGYIVWVPMLHADNADAARSHEQAITDARLHFWFDADKAAANTWSSYIGYPGTTWDVYAVFDGAATWDQDAPPVPRIWMHQLNTTGATRAEDRLDLDTLARKWLALTTGDAGPPNDLAEKLHAAGQAVSSAGTVAPPGPHRTTP